jgi:segregation and condensation protein A
LTTTNEPAGTLPAAWRVELPQFEGPLDLLLHLVKVNEVELTDIPVATICDQFHQYLQLMEDLNLDIAAEYIYEAALLIHLKSRMLLPTPRGVDGEEAEDPREELVQRLLEYRRMKEAAQTLAEVDVLRQGLWTRQGAQIPGPDQEESLDLGEVSLFDLLGALRQVLVRYENEHPPPWHIARETYSVRAQFERLIANLTPDHPVDLLADLRGRSCRAEAVAAFLAVLELARLRLVRMHQTERGELLLYRTVRELQQHELEAIQG